MAFGVEELPPDFWDTPAEEPSTPAPPRKQSSPAEVRTSKGAQADRSQTNRSEATRAGYERAAANRPEADRAESGDPEPTELEQAFEQLQSLFPGRVVEVRPQAADDGALDEVPAAPHDEEAAEGGYDDDDQDRLSFGPGGA